LRYYPAVRLVWAVLLAGCYGPTFTPNLPCSPNMDCPEGQRCDLPSMTCVIGDPPPGDGASDSPDGPPIPQGVVLAFDFENGNGNAMLDRSGFGNHGQITGVPTFATGKYGNGMQFVDVANVFIQINNSPTMDVIGTALTIAAWIHPQFANGTTTGVVIEKLLKPLGTQTEPPFVQYNLETTNSVFAGAISDGSTLKQCFFAIDPPDMLHHLAFTYDGTSMMGYVDGNLTAGFGANCNAPVTAITSNPHPIVIGQAGNNDERFVGIVDNLRVYNVVLTQAEIQADRDTEVVP
jgi:hypothetical protein